MTLPKGGRGHPRKDDHVVEIVPGLRVEGAAARDEPELRASRFPVSSKLGNEAFAYSRTA